MGFADAYLFRDHGGPTVQYAKRLPGRAVHGHRGDDPLLREVGPLDPYGLHDGVPYVQLRGVHRPPPLTSHRKPSVYPPSQPGDEKTEEHKPSPATGKRKSRAPSEGARDAWSFRSCYLRRRMAYVRIPEPSSS